VNPWWRSSAGQSAGTSSQRSRVRSSLSPRKTTRSCGEKEIMPDYGSGGGGSSPSGSASRSASSMGEHAVHTRGTLVRFLRRARQGRAIGSAASRKAAGRPVTGGSSPSPGTQVPWPPSPAAACPRGAAGKRGCFRNSRSPVRVGPGTPRRTTRGPWSNGEDSGLLNRQCAVDSRRAGLASPPVLTLWTLSARPSTADVIAHQAVTISHHYLLLSYKSLV
jgi:hypothetical protein